MSLRQKIFEPIRKDMDALHWHGIGEKELSCPESELLQKHSYLWGADCVAGTVLSSVVARSPGVRETTLDELLPVSLYR